MLLTLLSGASSMLISYQALAEDTGPKMAPHQQQAQAPRHMVEVPIKQNITEVVAASTMDLNVIYTPFQQVSLVQNAGQDFQIIDGSLYFQPTDNGSFSIYLSEADDPKSPIYMLTIVPSSIPIGQKIKLIPKEKYVPVVDTPNITVEQRKVGAERHIITSDLTFKDEVVAMLSAAATYISEPRDKNIPQNFIMSEDVKSDQYFIGNTLVSPDFHFAGPFYEIHIFKVTNKDNYAVQLTEADFAKFNPNTGEQDHEYLDQMAVGVGFFPQTVLAPQGSTSVILVHKLNIY